MTRIVVGPPVAEDDEQKGEALYSFEFAQPVHDGEAPARYRGGAEVVKV